jgi:hypothetical protein
MLESKELLPTNDTIHVEYQNRLKESKKTRKKAENMFSIIMEQLVI